MTLPSVICDLDGVVYRGRQAIPGAADALRRLAAGGWNVVFATNNSSRTPEQVAQKIRDVVGIDLGGWSVVTSAQAAVTVLPDHVETCLVLGGEGLRSAVEASGRRVVPSNADAVVLGIDSDFNYQQLFAATTEIRNGALFVASNVDPTFPTEHGLSPGAGALAAAVEVASGVSPLVAGKPEAPMRALIRAQGVGAAWVIGDRIETDIRMAIQENDWTSIVVLSGVSRADDDLTEADHVSSNLESAVDLVFGVEDRQ